MKQLTPMQILKPALSKFRTVPGFSCFELNKKQGGNTFVGTQMFKSKPVTFDYIIVLGQGGIYYDENNNRRHVYSISLAFNYIGFNTLEIRAGFCDRGSLDYSLSMDIDTVKSKLKSWFENPTVDNFVETFSIIKSSTVTNMEVLKMVTPIINEIKEIKIKVHEEEDILEKRLEVYNSALSVESSYAAFALVMESTNKISALKTSILNIVNANVKNFPAVARNAFNKQYEALR